MYEYKLLNSTYLTIISVFIVSINNKSISTEQVITKTRYLKSIIF